MDRDMLIGEGRINWLLEGKYLSDIGLVLSRTYEEGEGLISIDTETSELIWSKCI